LGTLALPGAVATFPFGINNRGHVVGFYLDADQARHGFLFRNGEFTTIDHPLAADDTQAHDLNDRGQIAGLHERGAGRAAQPRPSQASADSFSSSASSKYSRACDHAPRASASRPAANWDCAVWSIIGVLEPPDVSVASRVSVGSATSARPAA
jgi:probable HAF family extracellular repeat protein